MVRLVITAEVDESSLSWMGPKPDDVVAAFNEYYNKYPEDAFETAIMDPNFKIVSAVLSREQSNDRA